MVAGHRRWRACELAGMEEMPVIIREMDLIDTMFASLKINPVVEKMIGIREAGRVIVFNNQIGYRGYAAELSL